MGACKRADVSTVTGPCMCRWFRCACACGRVCICTWCGRDAFTALDINWAGWRRRGQQLTGTNAKNSTASVPVAVSVTKIPPSCNHTNLFDVDCTATWRSVSALPMDRCRPNTRCTCPFQWSYLVALLLLMLMPDGCQVDCREHFSQFFPILYLSLIWKYLPAQEVQEQHQVYASLQHYSHCLQCFCSRMWWTPCPLQESSVNCIIVSSL